MATDPTQDWFAQQGIDTQQGDLSGGVHGLPHLPGYTYDANGNITGLPGVLGGQPGYNVTTNPNGTQTGVYTPPATSQPTYSISTAQGSNTPQGVMDLFNQFIHAKGYVTGPAAWQGGGFGAGGEAQRGKLEPLVQEFNQATGLNAKVAGGDRIDFGNGPQDVITAGGDWWMGNTNGAPGPPGGGGSSLAGMGGGSGSGGASVDGSGSGGASVDGSGSIGPLGYTVPTYKLPTLEEIRATPGYQFAQEQGDLGIQRSAVAKGGLGGGTLKDLATFNQGLADNAGQQAVNNSLSAFGANTAAGQFGANYNLGAQGQLFNQDLSNRNFGLNQQGQSWNQGFLQNQNAFNQYNTNQNTAFNQWLALANLGNPGNPYA